MRKFYRKTELGKRSDAELKKITSRTLKRDIQLLEYELRHLESWESNHSKYLIYQEKYNSLFQIEVLPLKAQIDKIIEKNIKSYNLIFFELIVSNTLNHESRLEIQNIEASIKIIEQSITERIGPAVFLGNRPSPETLRRLRTQIRRYKDYLRIKLEKESKIELVKGLAATVTNESRRLADGIKGKLRKNEFCPYCNNKIVGFAHADHIYPIAKGGLSIARNMVYVCEDCNLKKGTLTLQSFIKKYRLNRAGIESNLELFDKDF